MTVDVPTRALQTGPGRSVTFDMADFTCPATSGFLGTHHLDNQVGGLGIVNGTRNRKGGPTTSAAVKLRSSYTRRSRARTSASTEVSELSDWVVMCGKRVKQTAWRR